MPFPEVDREHVELALDVLGAPCQLDVVAERQELLRFGGSRITYQHAEERLRLRARLVRDGRAAWGTIETLEPDALRALRTHLESLLAHLPPTGESLDAPGEAPRPAETCFTATVDATAEDRVALLGALAEALPRGTELGGSVLHAGARHVIANTLGLYRDETRTRAAIQVVASLDGGQVSSYGRWTHRDMATFDARAFGEQVAAGLAPLPRRGLEPGAYRAVLGPAALAAFVATFGQVALGGQAVLDGQSALSGCEGQPVANPLVTLVDDGCDPAGLPSSFDCTGAAKQRVALVDEGCFVGAVHDARTGERAGCGSTGHAVPPGWRFGSGPSPSHILVAPGVATDEDLLVACAEGIAIQRVDYLRVLHARETLVTGTTRDTTLWIKGGMAVARLPQFRFTLRLMDLLAAIEALGARRERQDAVFMESCVAPGAVVSSFPVGVVVG